ncbi:MBL fold metallo-hydrolase [Streptomyces sp. NBC_00637]|uniref:MBL fold metallo-hydrolase n=1 Tax=Streptomyces sp. NBC_00637 TaxID=2903667 RepID=UPI00325161A0
MPGRQPALVDTGFGGHADETAAWARTHARNVDLVVNTDWHSDHVGGNALLHAQCSAITADTPEADAITRRDPGCCAGRRCPACALGDLYLVRRSAGAAPGHSWPPSSSSFSSGTSRVAQRAQAPTVERQFNELDLAEKPSATTGQTVQELLPAHRRRSRLHLKRRYHHTCCTC